MKLIDLNDIKTFFAAIIGSGNWILEIDTVLHVLISIASLIYIVLKIKQLITKDKK